MLYFEDFMEAIENLPGELNESLTTVRQLDLLTQSVLEPLPETHHAFFEDCKYGRLSEYQQNIRYSEIVREYEKALVHCHEKREIMEKIYGTYKKLVRKLDVELEKFRLELEADNSGIHTMLGKPVNSSMKPERRRQRFRYQSTNHFKNPFLMRRKIIGQACRTALKSSTVRQTFPHKNESSHVGRPANRPTTPKSFRMKAPGQYRVTKSATVSDFLENPLIGQRVPEDVGSARRNRSTDYTHDPSLFNAESGLEVKPYPLINSSTKPFLEGDDEDGSSFGHDISSLQTKNSPLFNLPGHSEFSSGIFEKSGFRTQRLGSTGAPSDVSDTPSTTSRSTAAPSTDHRIVGAPSPLSWHGAASGRDRRSRTGRRPGRDALAEEFTPEASYLADATGFEEPHSNTPTAASESFFEPSSFGFVSDVKLDNAEEDDDDQKRYCVCNDVSYGDMIACDNPNCPFEWFHYSCVNLTVAPKGDWFCPSCIKSISGTKGIKKRISRR